MHETPANSNDAVGVTGLHHFSFTVSDIERSIAFYRDVFDMEVYWSTATGPRRVVREEKESYVCGVTGYPNAHLKIAILRYGVSHLELVQYIQPAGEPLAPGTHPPGSPHIAFTVADLDTAWAKLQRMKDRFNLEFVSDGPIDIDSGPAVGGRAIYFRDPDGITVELVELNQGWMRHPL